MTNSPNTQPIFIRTPVIHSIVLSTEIGDLLPNSTLVPKTFIIGSDPGTAIETIEVIGTGVAVATRLNLYLYNVAGTQGQSRLIAQLDVPAIADNTIIKSRGEVSLFRSLSPASSNPVSPNRVIRIPAGWELRAALTTAIANPIIVTAFGGNYY